MPLEITMLNAGSFMVDSIGAHMRPHNTTPLTSLLHLLTSLMFSYRSTLILILNLLQGTIMFKHKMLLHMLQLGRL